MDRLSKNAKRKLARYGTIPTSIMSVKLGYEIRKAIINKRCTNWQLFDTMNYLFSQKPVTKSLDSKGKYLFKFKCSTKTIAYSHNSDEIIATYRILATNKNFK